MKKLTKPPNADINEALKNAGVPEGLNPQARQDIDSALKAGKAEDLPASPDTQQKNSPNKGKIAGGNKENQAPNAVGQSDIKPSEVLDQIPTGRVMYVKDEPPLGQAPGQIIDLAAERQKHSSEISDTREAAGVSVKKFRHKGPTILRPEDRGLRTPIDYAGYLINTPDGSKLLYRSTLGAGVSVKNYDANGNEMSVTTFNGQLGETLGGAAETYPPNELPHLIDSAIALSQKEHEQLKQKIQAAGGRDKYLLQEAQRLVKEGQYPNIMDAIAEDFLTTAYQAREMLNSEDLEAKRKAVAKIGWNLLLKDEKLVWTYQKPYDILLKPQYRSDLRRG